MADSASKSVDGAVEELLLGDGFSIVDSTNAKADSKKEEVKKAPEKKPDAPKKKAPAEKEKTEKKSSPKQNSSPVKAAAAKTDDHKEKDDLKINGHNVDSKSDALLITTEEDLELDKKTESEAKEKSPAQSTEDGASKKQTEAKEKIDLKKKTGDVWVSNISRHVKATDLRKHFSRQGKVLTAKIVTNGRLFFGYILMENADVANKCVRTLHSSLLEGRKIAVSRQRPDSNRKAVPERTVKSTRTDKKSDKTSDTKTDKKSTKSDDKKSSERSDSKIEDKLRQAKKTEDRLKREVDLLKREQTRMKRFFSDEQRRRRLEQTRNQKLTRDLEAAEVKLKDERRKFERERELQLKNARTDRVRLEADRTMIKKELEEVKKLREYLKRKIEEETRPTERRPRASSPYAYSSKRFRDEPSEKSSKYVEERTRSPPSPPKLSRKRSPGDSFIVEKDRRHYELSSSYDKDIGRHGSSIVSSSKPAAPAAPRNIWPSAFHQEVWRVTPGSSSSAPFSSSQYARQSEYSASSSSNKVASYSQQRDYGKRDHYSSSSSLRKY